MSCNGSSSIEIGSSSEDSFKPRGKRYLDRSADSLRYNDVSETESSSQGRHPSYLQSQQRKLSTDSSESDSLEVKEWLAVSMDQEKKRKKKSSWTKELQSGPDGEIYLKNKKIRVKMGGACNVLNPSNRASFTSSPNCKSRNNASANWRESNKTSTKVTSSESEMSSSDILEISDENDEDSLSWFGKMKKKSGQKNVKRNKSCDELDKDIKKKARGGQEFVKRGKGQKRSQAGGKHADESLLTTKCFVKLQKMNLPLQKNSSSGQESKPGKRKNNASSSSEESDDSFVTYLRKQSRGKSPYKKRKVLLSSFSENEGLKSSVEMTKLNQSNPGGKNKNTGTVNNTSVKDVLNEEAKSLDSDSTVGSMDGSTAIGTERPFLDFSNDETDNESDSLQLGSPVSISVKPIGPIAKIKSSPSVLPMSQHLSQKNAYPCKNISLKSEYENPEHNSSDSEGSQLLLNSVSQLRSTAYSPDLTLPRLSAPKRKLSQGKTSVRPTFDGETSSMNRNIGGDKFPQFENQDDSDSRYHEIQDKEFWINYKKEAVSDCDSDVPIGELAVKRLSASFEEPTKKSRNGSDKSNENKNLLLENEIVDFHTLKTSKHRTFVRIKEEFNPDILKTKHSTSVCSNATMTTSKTLSLELSEKDNKYPYLSMMERDQQDGSSSTVEYTYPPDLPTASKNIQHSILSKTMKNINHSHFSKATENKNPSSETLENNPHSSMTSLSNLYSSETSKSKLFSSKSPERTHHTSYQTTEDLSFALSSGTSGNVRRPNSSQMSKYINHPCSSETLESAANSVQSKSSFKIDRDKYKENDRSKSQASDKSEARKSELGEDQTKSNDGDASKEWDGVGKVHKDQELAYTQAETVINIDSEDEEIFASYSQEAFHFEDNDNENEENDWRIILELSDSDIEDNCVDNYEKIPESDAAYGAETQVDPVDDSGGSNNMKGPKTIKNIQDNGDYDAQVHVDVGDISNRVSSRWESSSLEDTQIYDLDYYEDASNYNAETQIDSDYQKPKKKDYGWREMYGLNTQVDLEDIDNCKSKSRFKTDDMYNVNTQRMFTDDEDDDDDDTADQSPTRRTFNRVNVTKSSCLIDLTSGNQNADIFDDGLNEELSQMPDLDIVECTPNNVKSKGQSTRLLRNQSRSVKQNQVLGAKQHSHSVQNWYDADTVIDDITEDEGNRNDYKSLSPQLESRERHDSSDEEVYNADTQVDYIAGSSDDETTYCAQTQADGILEISDEEDGSKPGSSDDESAYNAQTQADDILEITDEEGSDGESAYLGQTQADGILEMSFEEDGRKPGSSDDESAYFAQTQADGILEISDEKEEGSKPGSSDDANAYCAQTQLDIGLESFEDDEIAYCAQTQADTVQEDSDEESVLIDETRQGSSEDEDAVFDTLTQVDVTNDYSSSSDPEREYSVQSLSDCSWRRQYDESDNSSRHRSSPGDQIKKPLSLHQKSSYSKTMAIEPQRLKTMKEKHEQFNISKQKFYSSKSSSNAACKGKDSNKTPDASSSGDWLSKRKCINLESSKKPTKSSLKQTKGKGKGKKSKGDELDINLTQKFAAAKSRLKERGSITAVNPQPVVRKQSSVRSNEMTDVQLPDLDEIIKKGLPVLGVSLPVDKHRLSSSPEHTRNDEHSDIGTTSTKDPENDLKSTGSYDKMERNKGSRSESVDSEKTIKNSSKHRETSFQRSGKRGPGSHNYSDKKIQSVTRKSGDELEKTQKNIVSGAPNDKHRRRYSSTQSEKSQHKSTSSSSGQTKKSSHSSTNGKNSSANGKKPSSSNNSSSFHDKHSSSSKTADAEKYSSSNDKRIKDTDSKKNIPTPKGEKASQVKNSTSASSIDRNNEKSSSELDKISSAKKERSSSQSHRESSTCSSSKSNPGRNRQSSSHDSKSSIKNSSIHPLSHTSNKNDMTKSSGFPKWPHTSSTDPLKIHGNTSVTKTKGESDNSASETVAKCVSALSSTRNHPELPKVSSSSGVVDDDLEMMEVDENVDVNNGLSKKLQSANVDKLFSSQDERKNTAEADKSLSNVDEENLLNEGNVQLGHSNDKKSMGNRQVLDIKLTNNTTREVKSILKEPNRNSCQGNKKKVTFCKMLSRSEAYVQSLIAKTGGDIKNRTNVNTQRSTTPRSTTSSYVVKSVAETQLTRTNLMEKLPWSGVSHTQVVSSMNTHQTAADSRRQHQLAPPSGNQVTIDNYLERILYWNPVWFDEFEKIGFIPPKIEEENKLFHIPEKMFSNYKDYVDIFTPHLVYETWEMIVQRWKMMKNRVRLSVVCVDVNRCTKKLAVYVWYGLMSKQQFEQYKKEDLLTEGLLVVVSMWGAYKHVKNIDPQKTKPHWLQQLGYIDKVQRHSQEERKRQILRKFPALAKESNCTHRDTILVCVTIKSTINYFFPQAECVSFIKPIVSLVTVLRQYNAMTGLQNSRLCQHILKPDSPSVFFEKGNVYPADREYFKAFNPSQQNVINTATKIAQQEQSLPRIALVQGPPGTGKSHTIISIIDKIMMDSQFNSSICLCAPSNAAVDEITRRLIAHRKRKQKQNAVPEKSVRVVRIGNVSKMHSSVSPYSLTEILRRNMREEAQRRHVGAVPESVKNDFGSLCKNIDRLLDLKQRYQKAGQMIEVQRVNEDLRKEEKKKFDMKNQYFRPAQPQNLKPDEEYQLKKDILQKAHVICGTLNTFGKMDILNILVDKRSGRSIFNCVIIDEASQANELDCLIPLQYGSSKLILVGDPEQLPPTVLSQKCSEKNYGQSLFERFYNFFKIQDQSPVMFLDTQYRMATEIASFPSKYVYSGKLKTDQSVKLRSKRSPLRPYLLYDLAESQEDCSQTTRSISNTIEADFIVCLATYIIQNTGIPKTDIGIIAPYKNQAELLKKKFLQHDIRVEVSTVDGFQGQEKEVIIFSCVRAQSETGSIGFMADRKRMNVALTRAKCALYLVGHLDSLKDGNCDWRNVIDDAAQRNLIYKVASNMEFNKAVNSCRNRIDDNHRHIKSMHTS